MSVRFWRNWAGNQTARANVVSPRTQEELCEAVRMAAEIRKDGSQPRVRAAGGSYSWSALVTNDDTIIDMHHLDRLIHLDPDEMTAEVECGMTIGQLDEAARRHAMTLITPTLFPRPTVGGVIATGSHGTSREHGNFSDNIIEMTVVKHDGTLATIRQDDPDFGAAQVALGTLGVVYSVKLKLEAQFNVYVEKRKVPVHEVLSGLDDLRSTNDSVEIFWWPFRSTMFVFTMNRTDSRPDKRSVWKKLLQKLNTMVQEHVAGTLLPWIAANTPNFTPILTFLSDKIAVRVGVQVLTASDAYHFQKAYPKCWDMSYAFPAKDAARAWADGIDLVNHYAEAGLYPVNLALHGRFTGESGGWLAPDHGQATGYVEAVTVARTPYWRSFFKELESRWLAIPGARPHWSKVYFQNREIAARYPKLDDFLEVRARWDPKGVFLNEFLEQTLIERQAELRSELTATSAKSAEPVSEWKRLPAPPLQPPR